MGRSGAYVLGGGLTLLAGLAMGWAAAPPGAWEDLRIIAAMNDTVRRVVTWYQSDPLDPNPDSQAAARRIDGGDPAKGRRLIVDYGCGACHAIPGIAAAKGRVGPALDRLATQAYIAGVLPNQPGGLMRWIVEPTTHSPQTAMPDLGVREEEARHMAAYLYQFGSR